MRSFQSQLFHKLDTTLFSLVDKIKTSPPYLKVSEEVSALDEAQRKILNQVIGVVLILTPLILIFMAYSGNSKLKNEIQIKQDILSYAQSMIDANKSVPASLKDFYSMRRGKGESEIRESLRTQITTTGIDLAQIEIKSLKVESAPRFYDQATINLGLKGLTLAQTKRLIDTLVQADRSKLTGLNLNRNESNQTLEGDLTLTQYFSP